MADDTTDRSVPKAEDEWPVPALPAAPVYQPSASGDPFEGLAAYSQAMAQRSEIRQAQRRKRILDSKTDFVADQAYLCWKSELQYEGEPLRCFLVESPVYTERMALQAQAPALYTKLFEQDEVISSLPRMGRFNGYVRFPRLPVLAPGYGGILRYVPVHGGITFFQDWWDGSVTYGFDTGHIWSSEIPEIVNDLAWMMAETESLARNLLLVARFEPYYLRAGEDNAKKMRVLSRMDRFLRIDPTGNFGVMVSLLSGEL